jgi:hypothetical protein
LLQNTSIIIQCYHNAIPTQMSSILLISLPQWIVTEIVAGNDDTGKIVCKHRDSVTLTQSIFQAQQDIQQDIGRSTHTELEPIPTNILPLNKPN